MKTRITYTFILLMCNMLVSAQNTESSIQNNLDSLSIKKTNTEITDDDKIVFVNIGGSKTIIENTIQTDPDGVVIGRYVTKTVTTTDQNGVSSTSAQYVENDENGKDTGRSKYKQEENILIKPVKPEFIRYTEFSNYSLCIVNTGLKSLPPYDLFATYKIEDGHICIYDYKDKYSNYIHSKIDAGKVNDFINVIGYDLRSNKFLISIGESGMPQSIIDEYIKVEFLSRYTKGTKYSQGYNFLNIIDDVLKNDTEAIALMNKLDKNLEKYFNANYAKPLKMVVNPYEADVRLFSMYKDNGMPTIYSQKLTKDYYINQYIYNNTNRSIPTIETLLELAHQGDSEAIKYIEQMKNTYYETIKKI